MTAADLESWLRGRPEAPALEDGAGRVLTYAELRKDVATLATRLKATGAKRIALLARAPFEAALFHLASLAARLTLVALPEFFSDSQLEHALRDSGVDRIVSDCPERLRHLDPPDETGALLPSFVSIALEGDPHGAGPARILYTSGTTGQPKGVRLGAEAMATVARSVAVATAIGPGDRHVALLPSAVLLEEVGGLLRGLSAGATVVLPPRDTLGLQGSCTVDAVAMLRRLDALGATTAILMPDWLRASLDAIERDAALLPRALRFVGAGGARVPPAELMRAARLGFPAFQGYGLSEAGSVVALNTPEANRIGSVGRPLPHVEVRVAADGELRVRGAFADGYLHLGPLAIEDGFLNTGDLGFVDDDGFVHLLGRKRDVFATAHGRKISPGWLEDLLVEAPSIRAAKVGGEGLASPVAWLDVAGDPAACTRDVAEINRNLPDYARIRVVHVRTAHDPAQEQDRWVSFET